MLPYISGHIDEVSSNKNQNIHFGSFIQVGNGQADDSSNQGHQVDSTVTDNCLDAAEIAFQQNGDVSELSRDFVSYDSNQNWDELFRISSSKGNTNCESVDKVVDQGAHQIEVPCRPFSLELSDNSLVAGFRSRLII